MKRAIIIVTLILAMVVGLGGCTTVSPPAPTPTPTPVPKTMPVPAQRQLMPEPKVWEQRTSNEHEVALNICSSLVRARLTGLASSQDAFDYVDSFFTHLTSCLSANGDSAGTINGQERHVQCPENAWHLVIYGMIPTGGITEMQVDDKIVPMMKYDVPDNWSRAVWLIYTNGTVVPYYNVHDKSDAAFRVEEDIAPS